MKLFYTAILFFLFSPIYSNTPKFQYCVSYCIKEDTLFDVSHKPLMEDGMPIIQCSNNIIEIRNGECPNESHQGLNTIQSPTRCFQMKNYNGQNFQGDGSRSYKDATGAEWIYYNIMRTGEADNPKAFISYSNKTGEYCLEIPLLKYKIVLFNYDEHHIKEGYYERFQLDGTKFIIESIRESLPKEPSNPVESKITYEFGFIFEDYRDNLIITNPNPFDREIKVTLSKQLLDSNSNLKLVLKDNIGNKVAIQNVEGPNTTISTLLVGKGKYILFLLKNEGILEFKQVVK